jgi:hypothetical protein
MSCCGQKRSEQKNRSASVGASTADYLRYGSHRRAPGTVRPGDPRTTTVALLAYLTRNDKLRAR